MTGFHNEAQDIPAHLRVRLIHVPYTDLPTVHIEVLLLNLSLAHSKHVAETHVVWADLFVPYVHSVQSVSGVKTQQDT